MGSTCTWGGDKGTWGRWDSWISVAFCRWGKAECSVSCPVWLGCSVITVWSLLPCSLPLLVRPKAAVVLVALLLGFLLRAVHLCVWDVVKGQELCWMHGRLFFGSHGPQTGSCLFLSLTPYACFGKCLVHLFVPRKRKRKRKKNTSILFWEDHHATLFKNLCTDTFFACRLMLSEFLSQMFTPWQSTWPSISSTLQSLLFVSVTPSNWGSSLLSIGFKHWNAKYRLAFDWMTVLLK